MLVSPPSGELDRIAQSFTLLSEGTDSNQSVRRRVALPTPHFHQSTYCGTVDIELKWTAWKSPVLPYSGYDNENDSGIPRRRASKRLRRSAADGSRSRAHPAAEPWPPSHRETPQAGIAVCG